MLILSFVFTMLPAGVCHAAAPTVTREYIARKTEGVKTEEERVCVDFKNLRLVEENYVLVSFINSEDTVVYEYQEELTSDFIREDAKFDAQKLSGTEYIRIELIVQGQKVNDIKVPMKI